jgi:hypothetical protein
MHSEIGILTDLTEETRTLGMDRVDWINVQSLNARSQHVKNMYMDFFNKEKLHMSSHSM